MAKRYNIYNIEFNFNSTKRLTSNKGMIEMNLQKGYRLKNYEIDRKLGNGGFGITYLAKDINLQKQVVIKEFFPKGLVERDKESNSVYLSHVEDDKKQRYIDRYKFFLKKFLEEARILANIEHPNIVKVLFYFKENQTAYFVMNYINGESLKKYVIRKGRLNQDTIISIIMPCTQ